MIDEKFLLESESKQSMLASKVVREDLLPLRGELVTGIDVSYRDDTAFTCATVMHLPTRSIVMKKSLVIDCEFPYIPGHFYLREGPAIISLLENLDDTGPIMIDGNGILHPRRMGLASYIGVMLNRQTIGVAKSLLLGALGDRNGNIAPITEKKENLGAALWLGVKKKPLYVSIGHRISLDTAIKVVEMSSFNGSPEPLHLAHSCSVNLRQ